MIWSLLQVQIEKSRKEGNLAEELPFCRWSIFGSGKGPFFLCTPKNDIEKRHALKMKFLIFLFVTGFLADDDDQQCEHIGKFLFRIFVKD
jgi:hypothetical protein